MTCLKSVKILEHSVSMLRSSVEMLEMSAKALDSSKSLPVKLQPLEVKHHVDPGTGATVASPDLLLRQLRVGKDRDALPTSPQLLDDLGAKYAERMC